MNDQIEFADETDGPSGNEGFGGPVVDVGFRIAGRAGAFAAAGLDLSAHDLVVVETSRGHELGRVRLGLHPLGESESLQGLPRVLRLATDEDLRRADHNRTLEAPALEVFIELARQQRLAVKPIRAHYRFDGGRAVVYFFASERADVRPLGRDLSQRLHTRVELLQVGEREETRLIGGIGSCGRELCCSTWISDFAPVSIKMAKEQGLSLNPSKLAGMCGRLKCCLRYEYDTYLELKKDLPRIGERVETVKGNGRVIKHKTLEQHCLVRREDDDVIVECSLEDIVTKKEDRNESSASDEPEKN